MAKSFLERIQPSRQRWKLVDWPFSVEDGERPRVKVSVLGHDIAEEAYFAAVDHFKKRKPAVSVTDAAFAARERAEIVWRAYRCANVDEPLTLDTDELVRQPVAMIDELYTTWRQFQDDVCAVPATAGDMDALVELLKKNTPAEALSGLPSSWLIGLITTLANRLADSTAASSHG